MNGKLTTVFTGMSIKLQNESIYVPFRTEKRIELQQRTFVHS